MITNSSTAETIPSYLNFQLDRMGARANGKTDNVCVYIDDLVVTENGIGEIPFTFASGDAPAAQYKKTISFDDLETWRFSGTAGKEVNDQFDMGLGGIGLADLQGGLVGNAVTADHSTGTGKRPVSYTHLQTRKVLNCIGYIKAFNGRMSHNAGSQNSSSI